MRAGRIAGRFLQNNLGATQNTPNNSIKLDFPELFRSFHIDLVPQHRAELNQGSFSGANSEKISPWIWDECSGHIRWLMSLPELLHESPPEEVSVC